MISLSSRVEKHPRSSGKKKKRSRLQNIFFRRTNLSQLSVTAHKLLISAGLLKGGRPPCYKSVAQEMRDAGALYEDKEVVVDKNLITSRQPSDLPDFLRETIKA